MKLVITGATVYTTNGRVVADVVVENGRVTEVGNVEDLSGMEHIDGTGLMVGPGFVDIHVHFRDPGQTWKEDISSGAAAAAAGGYTAVVMMPNTIPPIDSGDALNRVSKKVEAEAIEIGVAGAITMERQGVRMSHFDELYAGGVRIFTDDGDCVADGGILRSAMKYLQGMPGAVIAQHAEDQAISMNGHAHAGPAADRLGVRGISPSAEEVIVARDLILAAEAGVHYHAQHVSTAKVVAMIRTAKESGQPVSAEVTPHHLALTDAEISTMDTNAKMYPPLRGAEDRQALVEGLIDGTIDAVATDHAPHTPEEKDTSFESAPRGVIGLETALPVVLQALDGDVGLLFQRMSVAPAAIAGMTAQGQMVSVGSPANLVIFDPEATWTAGDFVSRSSNSPFSGRQLKGKVVATISNGNVVYREKA